MDGDGATRYASFRQKPKDYTVKFTKYFEFIRKRADRAMIRDEWLQRVINAPMKETLQKDGRIRRWAPIGEMGNRYLRVVLLPDRRFKP